MTDRQFYREYGVVFNRDYGDFAKAGVMYKVMHKPGIGDVALCGDVEFPLLKVDRLRSYGNTLFFEKSADFDYEYEIGVRRIDFTINFTALDDE
ncbi:MAG: hypothetical protein GOVbin631_40 [Prokaryotic dsDNA virus sp.]|nr:MAG: hypothetical protein GOVbin631_40 [Prokaryotic dsDNA virus sp.]|tara:strand:+ start:16119 stop:16400 length:282 start_codon:yes stop_codon:yes gene_type:complete